MSISKKRRIAVVTSSRADYGHLFWPMKKIMAHADLELELIVMGSHLSSEYGNTVEQITADGFAITARVDCLDPEDSDAGMARTIGSATSGLTRVLAERRPDLLLLIADRYEMLAPATVALALRIPIAHIEGGDISEGAIDDAVRNALTKMSHLHFTPTEDARLRVMAMGEEAWRVMFSGAPSLDHLRLSRRPDRQALEGRLGMKLSGEPCVIAYHPVTLNQDTTSEADALFTALQHLQQQVVFCFPNPDAGHTEIVDRARRFCAARDNAQLYVNLDHLTYWSLLEHAALMVGNSSSGIMESPSLELPCVDVGDRQKGRTRAANIIHADADTVAIIQSMEHACAAEFRASLAGLVNPYGDGHASDRIIGGLIRAPSKDRLLRKRALKLNRSGGFDNPAATISPDKVTEK